MTAKTEQPLPSKPKRLKTIRHHRKCRTGCLECKRRKIKCSEQKPVCSQCHRASSNCVYLVEMTAAAKLASEQRRSPDFNSATEHQSVILKCSVTDSAAGMLAAGTSIVGSVPTFTLAHMELLHHWSTVTGSTTTRAQYLQAFWRTKVTGLALQHGFLLSSLLAFTARHLSRLRPSRQSYYENLAERLQNASLRALNNGRLLLQMSKDTSTPLILFSSMTWMNAVAASGRVDDGAYVLQPCRNWLIFLRGVMSVVIRAKSWLTLEGIAPLLLPKLTWDRSKPPPTDDPLKEVESLVFTVQDVEKRLLYIKAVKDLRFAFFRLHYLTKDSCCLADLFTWPTLLPARYIELLMDDEPEALVIFAHYAVLLSKESSVWWLQGKGESIILSIYSHLSPYYRRWVEWPMQQIS